MAARRAKKQRFEHRHEDDLVKDPNLLPSALAERYEHELPQFQVVSSRTTMPRQWDFGNITEMSSGSTVISVVLNVAQGEVSGNITSPPGGRVIAQARASTADAAISQLMGDVALELGSQHKPRHSMKEKTMPRKPIADLIAELRSWLPNYDHGPDDYPTIFYRILANAPGADELVDIGYEPIGNMGWHELDLLGRVLVAIQDKRDVEDLVAGLVHEEGEEVEEARGPHTSRITDADIRALRSEAAAAGDSKQVAVCDRALRGDKRARSECERVILDARAQLGESRRRTPPVGRAPRKR